MSFFKKIRKRLKTITKLPMSDKTICRIKSAAWSSEKAVKMYLANVEQAFFNRSTVHYYTQYLNPDSSVLDIGAGSGRLSYKIADIGCTVTAVDISSAMLEALNKHKKAHHKIQTMITSANESLPFLNNQFDSIVQMDFLVHFPNWKDILKEEARVCKQGGFIIFNMLNSDNLKRYHQDLNIGIKYITNGDFFASYGKEELENFCLDNGLEVFNIHPYGYFLLNIRNASALTAIENTQLRLLLNKSLTDPEILEAMVQFEEQIVSKMPHDACTTSVVVLRKK